MNEPQNRREDAAALPTDPAPPGTSPTVQRPAPTDGSAPTVIRSEPSPRAKVPPRLGPYELGEEIGHGGMGIVFRARHVNLGTTCAVKVLIAGEHASPESLARFHREAAAVARMGRHPNIVTVHDLGQEGGITYYAMEYVDGTSLDERLAIGPLPPREAAAIVEPIARALHFAHGHGIIHRDLKPANVLLRADGTPLVMDFGLARDIAAGGRLSLTGEVFGSPNYMSPEQVHGKHEACDARTDVYGLGGILYEALMGQPPHPGVDIAAIFEKILAGEVLRPRRLRPSIPRDIETVCLRCLETEPSRRYPTAEALADDLARFLRGEPVAARPVGMAERLWRAAVRRRAVVLPLTFAFLIAAGFGAWELVGSMRRSAAAQAALELGRGFREKGQAREALDAFQKAVSLGDSSEEARAGLEWARETLRQIEEQLARQNRQRVKEELVGAVIARWTRFRRVATELERLAYDKRIGDEERRRRADACWQRIQEFIDATPADSASHAAMLACVGMTLIAAGDTEAGLRELRKSSECDPEVPLGQYYEVVACFRTYVESFPVPTYVVGAKGWTFRPTRAEAMAMAPLRERVRDLVERLQAFPSWGTDPDLYRRCLDAVQALDREDFEAAEAGLTDAISVPGGDGFESHFLLARAKVRYRLLKFDGALEDLEEAGRHLPGYPLVPFLEACVRMSRAEADRRAGRDPRPELDRVIAACARALEYEREFAAARNLAGHAWDARASAERSRGEDPRASLGRALAELEEAVRIDPDRASAAANLANVRMHLAEDEAGRGIDPRPRLERALRDLSEAIQAGADEAATRISRALIEKRFATLEHARGANPRVWVEAAIADYTRAIEFDPEGCEAWNNRASQRLWLAKILAAEGKDPTALLEEALADCAEAIVRNAEFAFAFANRAQVNEALGLIAEASGADPLPRYGAAVRDYRAAIELAPSMVELHGATAGALMRMAAAEEKSGVDPGPRYAEVIEACETSLRHVPGNATVQALLDQARAAAGKRR